MTLLLVFCIILSVFPMGAMATQTAEDDFYSFDLLGKFPGGPFSKDTFAVRDQKALIKQYFDEGKIGWAFEGYQNGTKDKKGQGEIVESFPQNKFSKDAGIQVYTSGFFWWYAIRVKSPGTGYYDMTLQTNLASGGKHSIWTETYFFDAAKVTGDTDINDLLVKRNRIENFTPTGVQPNALLGNVKMEASKDYILVLRMTADNYDAANADGLRTKNMYLKGLTFTETAAPVVDTSKVVYNFDLADPTSAAVPADTYLDDVMDELSGYYAEELQNWEPLVAGADARFKWTGGLTTYGKVDDYTAVRIRFPGSGLYTLSLNHGTSGRGATGAVYVLPGDTEDILFAMDNHNRVGKVAFYNDSGDTKVKDGAVSVIGTWEFEANKEYIIVFEAYEQSPFFENAYMYIDQLVCEKGDKTTPSQGAVQPHSVIVDPAPVKLLENGPSQAVAEINGDDYFFLPFEGRKLAVYNLDTGALVDYTDLPFNLCRGMVVDPEGILWMVGDNGWIAKYDPYLNICQKVYFYKGKATDGSQVDGITSAFNCAIDEEGCIYFGCYPVGVLAKYNTRTGEFTNMGKAGSLDSSCYASAPVYDNGFIYITSTGDMNGDGVKTFELSKFNAKTGELIKRIDVSEYFGKEDVMIRGMGICGGVLILGGEANVAKKTAAFDAETFEYVDLQIPASTIYAPTGEIDGKIWLSTPAGIWEFDGATRKATPVKGLEAISTAFRCGVNCFMTVEEDALFPGQSIVTFRGNTGNPAIYNTTTGRYKQLEGVVLPEYGSTSTVRPIINVPGENGHLYVGSFNTDYCSVYDVNAGKVIQNFQTYGQTDSILIYEGKIYVGNYNRGILTQINLDDANRNVPLLSLKTSDEQSRIHALAGGDGKVFVGSTPDRYELGGCLAWIDIGTFDKHIERNVVQDQSIISLAYHENGYVIGGSEINGGSGSVPAPNASAKFFVYDVANKKKVAEYDLRDYFDDAPDIINAIDGLTVDENGRVWMVAYGSLFSFTFDASTKKIDIRKEVTFGKSSAYDNFPTPMLQIDGYLYANYGTVGGVQKVNMSDPSDCQRIPIPATDFFAVGSDGNFYYTQNTAPLYMYPMTVTDEDRRIASELDATLLTLKNNTTLDSAADISAARAAYEKLTWTQKALIYNLDILVAAEIDLLECKIDAIGDVTVEKEKLVYDLKAEYQALSVKNKSYVKNFYTVLVPALQEMQGLVDVREANRVQAMIDTIPGMGEITLEKESAIREIETAYKALTKTQRTLLKDKALQDALATIQKLRQEKIVYLQQLIAGIGDVTLEDEAVITEARELFNWLTHVERETVDYITLNAAESGLKKLQQAKAAEVDALILAIGDTIDHSSKDAIEAARKAYDALTPGAQAMVKNLAILTEAEAIYAGLGMSHTTIIIIAAAAGGAVLIAAAVVVVLLVLKKKKAAPTEEGTVEETPAEPEV